MSPLVKVAPPPGARLWRLLRTRLFALAAVTFCASPVLAQNVNVNPGGLTYASLQAAFTAINTGLHTGSVTVDIVGDTTELAPAVLNASGAGSALLHQRYPQAELV